MFKEPERTPLVGPVAANGGLALTPVTHRAGFSWFTGCNPALIPALAVVTDCSV